MTGNVPWFLEKKAVWIGLIVVGPLALPLLWFSPKFSGGSKVWICVLTVALTVLTFKFSEAMLGVLEQRLSELKQLSG